MDIIQDNKEIFDKFKALPKTEKVAIHKEAQELVDETIQEFVSVLDSAPCSSATRLAVLETVWGVKPNETFEEAMRDNSDFSKRYDLAVIAAIITIMKDKEAQP